MKLKNIKLKITTLLLACSLFSSTLFAVSSIPIYINGSAIDASRTPAYVSASYRTMIPVRAVGEVLGLGVQWQTPYVILQGKSLTTNKAVTVKMNAKTAEVVIDGVTYANAIESKENRSYVTLRVLAEAFGYKVDWRNKCVYIDNPSASNSKPSVPESTPSVPESTPSVPESTPSQPQQKPEDTQSGTNSTYVQQVLDLVNAERAKSGLKALVLDDELSKVAAIKSTDMRTNKYFEHNSPTYGTPFEMLKQFGISYTAAAENIAQGYSTPQAVVTGWMNSAGHRANIMNGTYTHIGIGYDSNGHYWTQLFIKK